MSYMHNYSSIKCYEKSYIVEFDNLTNIFNKRHGLVVENHLVYVFLDTHLQTIVLSHKWNFSNIKVQYFHQVGDIRHTYLPIDHMPAYI